MTTTNIRTSKADRYSDRDAHAALKRLYAERAPDNMTQEEFGATYGIGTQGMVWQYLNGKTPLTLEAAAKFALGLGCTIADISPSLARSVRTEVIPVLGQITGKARRAAAVMVTALTATLVAPEPASAALHNSNCAPTEYRLCDWLRRLLDALFPRPRLA